MTKKEQAMRAAEQEKIFYVACDIARNINAALRHGAKIGGEERRETYADGVCNTCQRILKKLFIAYGSEVFVPAWDETETGEKIVIIMKK